MTVAVWLFSIGLASLTRVAASAWWATLWVVHRGAQGAERPESLKCSALHRLFSRAEARPPLGSCFCTHELRCPTVRF